jgi:hypothetical protein
MTDAIAQEFRRLSSEAAIRTVLATVCDRLDEYDIDAFVDLFTEDCRFSRESVVTERPTKAALVGDAVGNGELKVMVSNNQARYARTNHQIGNIVIALHKDEADCVSNASCWHREHDGNTVVCTCVTSTDSSVARTRGRSRIGRSSLTAWTVPARSRKALAMDQARLSVPTVGNACGH